MKVTKVETIGGKIVCRAIAVQNEGPVRFKINDEYVPSRVTNNNLFVNFKLGDEVLLECQGTDDGYQLKITDGLVTIVEEEKEKIQDTHKSINIGQIVYHKEIYHGKEPMKIIGIREKEVELEGDYSGGTHAVCQSSWMPIEGLFLKKILEEETNEANDISTKGNEMLIKKQLQIEQLTKERDYYKKLVELIEEYPQKEGYYDRINQHKSNKP